MKVYLIYTNGGNLVVTDDGEKRYVIEYAEAPSGWEVPEEEANAFLETITDYFAGEEYEETIEELFPADGDFKILGKIEI